ncbi:MAG: CRISPR system precrRNA processing endoribonuclease RAMP protein Cas6 [Chloroflexota bacterium]|nr:CRISPR system precrRNA processing endoribonuclease RAMP protein Cas6 [Chloroflexota bacterium]
MLLAAVINVEALEDGYLPTATGRLVHGLWFRQWQACDAAVADRLHAEPGPQPFTLSPLLDVPRPQHGKIAIRAGQRAWFRVTALTADLAARTAGVWLAQLPVTLSLGRIPWRVAYATVDANEHPWAGWGDAQALAERCLLAAAAPAAWSFEFLTPTTFHGEIGHLPFPLPYVLLGSWLRTWQAFSPVPLPAELGEATRNGLVISSYQLKTVPVRDRKRLVIGCVGHLQLRALEMTPLERAAVDLLAHYAFWAGSGHHTPQGMGLTRLRA